MRNNHCPLCCWWMFLVNLPTLTLSGFFKCHTQTSLPYIFSSFWGLMSALKSYFCDGLDGPYDLKYWLQGWFGIILCKVHFVRVLSCNKDSKLLWAGCCLWFCFMYNCMKVPDQFTYTVGKMVSLHIKLSRNIVLFSSFNVVGDFMYVLDICLCSRF